MTLHHLCGSWLGRGGRGGRAACGALAALLLCASGCASSPVLHTPAPQAAGQTLFVVKRGWHIDIGVAVQELTPPLRTVRAQLPEARYLLFGFGDRRYLTARSKRLDALLAALRPGAALVLLTALPDTPEDAFGAGAVRVLRLDVPQMQALQAFVWQTLAHAQGLPVRVQSGPYSGSVYLAAQPRYSGLHTCNSWVAEALHAAALPVRVRGVIFARQLWRQLPRLQRAQRQPRATPGGAHAADSARAAAVRAPSDQLQGGAEPSWQTTVV
ncbi:MAG TPA: DUF2459 domain-containing protein [Steroidobacteraceae bacterium]|nr:DUF2459 domain-containing protein [Steroidobacteraceae bacterium]